MHRRISGALGFGRNKKKDGSRPESQRTIDSIDLEPPPGWVLKRTLDDIPYFFHKESGIISETNPADEYDDDEGGEWTWAPHPKDLWQPAKIQSREKDGSVIVINQAGQKIVIPKGGKMKNEHTEGRLQEVPLWKLKLSDLRHVEDDLVMLSDINEGSIMYNLQQKYRKSQLYTWVGATKRVLVSINPYRKFNMYGDDQIKEHHDQTPNRELPPHIFDIAEQAYKEMLNDGRNQSILISGESGAGKTEATKHCLKFWAKVAGSKNGVEEKLIQANPVLEAFGNAKTIRNNNSSRFGKWMEVYFSLLERSIDGASITNFLLEKSRLVFQQSGERNFHIFYQMLSDAETKKKYSLSGLDKMRYTMKGLITPVTGLDDASDFEDTKRAMDDLGMTTEEKEWLLRTCAAVLHLGNCTFEKDARPGGVSGSKLEDEAPAKTAAKFLGVSEDQLKKILVQRTITVRTETSVIPLDPDAARFGADSLAKGVYSRLFDWIVNRCNAALQGDRTGKTIGVLDIFGFEIFEVNSFEQLCINFCNEKLQQLFNLETFREEEKLYEDEQIQFTHITFVDSDPVLQMIEKGPDGILPTLDDECKLDGDDKKFVSRITATWQSHKNFGVDRMRKLEDKLAFEIVHYAGTVNYTTSEFKAKNKDTFAQDAQDLGASSADGLTKSLFPPVEVATTANGGKVQAKSLSYTFRTQLNTLMEKLKVTATRYVRCIKPNDTMAPMLFDPVLVVRQLRYSGVFEACAIRKQGYPFRFKYEVFAIRFKLVNTDHDYEEKTPRKIVEEIFDVNPNLMKMKKDVAFGKTMILYRAPVYKMLKLLRNLALETIVPRVKGVMRGILARKMRRSIEAAEKELKAAFATQTDIQAMRTATGRVDEILGTIGSRLFPEFRPRMEAKVLERIVLLQKVVDEEVKVDALLQTDPNERYKDWVAQRFELEVVADVPKHPPQKEKFDKFLSILANCDTSQKLQKIQEEYLNKLGRDLYLKVVNSFVQSKQKA